VVASPDANFDPRPTRQHISLQEAIVQGFVIANTEGGGGINVFPPSKSIINKNKFEENLN
jgi:hypothetical protein